MDDPRNNPAFEGTMVDLGEDLLEATRVMQRPEPQQSAPTEENAAPKEDDDLQKGEILMNERLFEDAKKVFRKILRSDPGNDEARRFLDEIQKQELQDLLGGGDAPRKKFSDVEATSAETPDSVLSKLEKDLHISVDKTELKPVPDLFKDGMAFTRYRETVMDSVVALAPRDRIDIGVAYLEMGLFEIAQSIFETVVRYDDHRVPGMYLLGIALICGGKAIEATIRLEPLARELTLSESQKCDFLYLMGLAFERLSDIKKAREFYRRVHLLNPKYRDVVEKLK